MIPKLHTYYRDRALEHRRLAAGATVPDQKLQHEKLVDAYKGLAKKALLRQRVRLTA